MTPKSRNDKGAQAEVKAEHTINPDLAARPSGQEGIDFLTAIIGRQWGDKSQSYEVYFTIPKLVTEVGNEKIERYGCTFQDLVNLGIRNLTTKPQYLEGYKYEVYPKGHKNEGKPKVETAKLISHTALQKIADDYRPGQRDLGKARVQAAKAAVLDDLSKFQTIEELQAYLIKVGLATAKA